MALNFPNTPVLDDVYGIYRWDGEKWTTSAENPPALGPRTIFTQTPELIASNANTRTNFRIACTLTEDMGSEFRFTLAPGLPADTLTVFGAAAGIYESGLPSSTIPLVEVMYEGVRGFTGKTTPQTCDWTPAGDLSGLKAGDTMLISYQTGSAGECATTWLDGSTNSKSWWQSDFDNNYWLLQSAAGLGFNDTDDMVFGMVSIEARGTGSGGGVDPDPPPDYVDDDLIPIGFNDPMFTGMTDRANPITLNPGQNLVRTSIDEHSGASTISCTNNNVVAYCRVFSRECVRVTGSVFMHHCYFEALGIITEPPDHADTVQHYSPGEIDAVVVVKNCHIRGHLTEATATYFISDFWDGSVEFENVILESGPFAAKMHADNGCHIDLSFKDCYFVGPWQNEYGNVPYVLAQFGTGTMTIVLWENVRFATIVDNVLVPGAVMPEPIPEGGAR
jgi:hypothetical protein